MKLFKDKTLTEEIIDYFSFGIVPVGEVKQETLWLKNDSNPKTTGRLIDLEFEVVCLNPQNDTVIIDERVDILDSPREMAPYAVEPLKLEWTPRVDLEQGLKAKLTIKGKKIVG